MNERLLSEGLENQRNEKNTESQQRRLLNKWYKFELWDFWHEYKRLTLISDKYNEGILQLE